MKTNIFSKLLSTYLVIILITLLVVGLFLAQMFQNYYYNARQNELTVKGQEVSAIFINYMLGFQDPRTSEDLLFLLDRFLDARVVPVERNNLLLASCPGFHEFGLSLTDSELDNVLNGQIVSKRGYHQDLRIQMATVVVPMFVFNEVVGAVFLHAPLTGIAGTIQQVHMLIFYAALAATVLSTIVGLYMSKSISHPLQQMNRAALEVAGGNYRQQVEVTSTDEVGQLAHTFNYMSSTLQETIDALSQEKTKLENIMLSMSEGVVAVDDNGSIILANPQARSILGFKQADLTGSLISGEMPPAMSDLFHSVLQGRIPETEEYTLRNGKIVSLHVSPLQAPDAVWGAVGVIQDVSEIRRLEQMRQDFVANVSHELRTPMTSIQGFVEALMDGLVDDKESQARCLSVILDETVRLNRLVNDLLDLSGLETGQVRWPVEPVSLPPLLNQVITKLQPQLDKQSLDVSIDSQPGLPQVLGNRDRIQQVLINLLGNAVSFTPPGGRITLSLSASPEDGFVKVSVSDTGMGIPPAEQEKIWERFHKVDRSRTRSAGGTGLGLAIVRQIVEAHGGGVGLISIPGKGSTFYFTLKTV
ncbi:MAG: HAMP domain-containing protein [Dethiobacter sp.]|jgi:two-component system sensor histidine kinase ResE|nr:HAMP domain-containing protein [Dethiobacter sp.]